MGQEYSMEVVERAEELYCVEGHTFDAVATLTAVSVSSLKRWSEHYGWQEKKDEIRQAMSSIRLNKIKLRASLITNCLATLNAQDAFAVASIESMALKAAEIEARRAAGPSSITENLREIKTDEDAVAALEEALQIKLNTMLANPARLNLAAVKEVKTVSEFIAGMKAKFSKAETGAPGSGSGAGLEGGAAGGVKSKTVMTRETAEAIRKRLLMGVDE